MGDDKQRKQPDDPNAPRSPFEDESVDWDSEIAAWDAALPLGSERPPKEPPTIVLPVPPPERTPQLEVVPFDTPTPTRVEAVRIESASIETAGDAPVHFEETDLDLGEIDLFEQEDADEMPASTTSPVESGRAFVIPDVEQLSAMTLVPVTPDVPTHAPMPLPAPSTFESTADAPPQTRARTLTEDGLPELSGLHSVDALFGPEGSRPEPGGLPDVFDAEPPEEEEGGPVALPTDEASALFAPQTLLEPLGQIEAADVDGRYWHEQVALWTDELAAAKGSGGRSEEAIAGHALVAARAAERAGATDIADRLYDEALTRAPGFLPALRGKLRLRLSDGRAGDVAELLRAMAAAAPDDERRAYETLALEWLAVQSDAGSGDVQGRSPSPTALDASTGGQALTAAERALRSGDRRRAADELATAAQALNGQAGRTLLLASARLLDLEQDAHGASSRLAQSRDAADGVSLGHAIATLRHALGHPAPQAAASALEEAAHALPAPNLRRAVLRRVARLTRQAGDQDGALALLREAAAVESGIPLPARDRLSLLSGSSSRESDPAAALDAFSTEDRVLAALRLAEIARRSDQPSAALSTLRQALDGRISPVPLALAAEEIGRESSDPALRARAWRLWGDADPARRAHAAWTLAEDLSAAGDQSAAAEALKEASLASAHDPAFWTLAWRQLRVGDRAAAATALAQGADGWNVPGAEAIVAGIRERVQELRLAINPTQALTRTPTLTQGASESTDDPADLIVDMLGPRTDPAEVARRLLAGAGPGLGHRVVEAAIWMIQAGKGDEALAWLLARRPAGPLSPAVTALLQRLVRLHAKPEARPAIFADLRDASGSENDRLLFEFQRAEALEAAGDRAAAATAFRELLVGSLSADADLGLRRVLWSTRQGEALSSWYRDESDAFVGAGQTRAAAAALVDLARVKDDLLGDEAAARVALTAAREQDATNSEARFALLADAARSGRFTELVFLLEECAGEDLRSIAGPLYYLAALIDEGQAGGGQTNRLVDMAIEAGGSEPPQALLLRALAAASARAPKSVEAAIAGERTARVLGAQPDSDGRATATLLVRAAGARIHLGETATAERLLREALGHDPECVPALVWLLRYLLAGQDYEGAAALCDTQASVFREGAHRAQACLVGAAIAEQKLRDPARATTFLRRALEIDPLNEEAFGRLRALLDTTGDHAAIAELLAMRLRGALDPEAAFALRLDRAAILAGELGDRAAAKDELRTIVAADAQHVLALSRLAALEIEDGAFAVAAELCIRQARFDRDPERLREAFLRIGRLYMGRLWDPRVAAGAYERVLRLDAENREALEALSELYTKQEELRKALAVTDAIIEREPDAQQRLPFMLRTAGLWEKLGESRKAAAALKKAAEDSPRSLQAVGELARFYERSKETQARNVLLDGSIKLLRDDLRQDPRDPAPLRALIPLLRWRQRPACSAAAAQALAVLSADPTDKSEGSGWSLPPSHGRRLSPLSNPDLDELAFSSALPPGVRNVMRLVGPALDAAAKPNLKRWQVTRGDRVADGTGVREIADAIGGDLGARQFELYVSAAHPWALAVEPGDPPVVILGRDLIARGTIAVRFASAYALRLVATRLHWLAQGSTVETAGLLAAIVRQFVPDYRHPDLSDGIIAASTSRIGKAIGRNLRAELAPFAAEIAVPFDIQHLHAAVHESAARAGQLASGDLATALQVLFATAEQPLSPDGLLAAPAASALVDFALSEEHHELVAALEAVS